MFFLHGPLATKISSWPCMLKSMCVWRDRDGRPYVIVSRARGKVSSILDIQFEIEGLKSRTLFRKKSKISQKSPKIPKIPTKSLNIPKNAKPRMPFEGVIYPSFEIFLESELKLLEHVHWVNRGFGLLKKVLITRRKFSDLVKYVYSNFAFLCLHSLLGSTETHFTVNVA